MGRGKEAKKGHKIIVRKLIVKHKEQEEKIFKEWRREERITKNRKAAETEKYRQDID